MIKNEKGFTLIEMMIISNVIRREVRKDSVYARF
ncbi:prepilin-type N-terminal cleavage/methylation domain-containing protein [Sporosarcina sp. P13]|nr:prepilin-type N-terminal cleavage/methylation domain-containing protein [Sporosarcina sp. P13]